MGNNAISTFVMAKCLHLALKHVDKAGLVKNLAKELDACADTHLSGRSERFQEDMVKTILLPLARELMCEDRQRYVQLLESEQHGNFGTAQRQPERGSVREIIEDRSDSVTRQEAQSSHQNFTVRRRSTDNG